MTTLIRATVGLAIGAGIDFYADHYIPPVLDELNQLSNTLLPVSPSISMQVSRFMVLGAEMHESIARGQLFRPAEAQLGPLINIPHAVLNAAELATYIKKAEDQISVVAKAATGADVTVEFHDLKFARDVFTLRLKPERDIHLLTEMVESAKGGDKSAAMNKLGELASEVMKYGSISIRYEFKP